MKPPRSGVAGGRKGPKAMSHKPPEKVVDVVIEEPAGIHNVFGYDQRRRALRLSRVVYQEGSRPFELGGIVNTLTEDGCALPVLVPVTLPTFAGCYVDARIVGSAELAGGRHLGLVCIGVPRVDARWDDVADMDGLPVNLREALLESLPGFVRWLTGEETAALIRKGTEAYWEAKARADSDVRHGAAWKVTAPPRGAGERGEAEPHTWAEYLVPSLPFRFQKYVEELLLPEERILLFVERPQFVAPGAQAILRRQKLRHGLLVITDRQAMTMLDSLPPDSTMVDWGYIAKATAIERVESAWLERSALGAEFTVTMGSRGGVERHSMLFPQQHGAALQEAAELLGRFLQVGASDVRRVYDGKPAGVAREALGMNELKDKYPHVVDVISQAGENDVLVAAAARGPEGRGRGPALVITPDRVSVFPGSRSVRGPVACQQYAIADVSSVEIVQSLPGCRFDIFLPTEEEVEKVTLRYEYPDSPAFAEAFVTLRHLLGKPLHG